ncbi:MAG: 7-cyano-7-deazaguanine synthase QueC [Candidatus Omnitrophica bacterium]|nr:7-cyano-7-deazaguanine synthase QueC [Candidatus Omnitrophota bacterium]
MSSNGKSKKRCVVLLSGGLDSATVLYFAKRNGFSPVCLIFDYGQKHRREIESAKSLARAAGCPYKLVKISLPWQGSSLLDRKIKVPAVSTGISKGSGRIPSTYVPARNTIFLSFAVSFAEAILARAIFIGANAVDYSNYPDCRPEFYRAFEKVIARGTKAGVEKRKIRVLTPLINLTKARIIKLGVRLGVPYELTWSCYKGQSKPCGKCESCFYRAKGFRQAAIADPALRAR